MRLTLPELLLVWLVALACGVVAVGALTEFGTNRAGVGIAVMCALFAYGLVTRHVMAVPLSLLVAVVGLVIAILCVVEGPISYGLIGGVSAALYLLMVGRAALYELMSNDVTTVTSASMACHSFMIGLTKTKDHSPPETRDQRRETKRSRSDSPPPPA